MCECQEGESMNAKNECQEGERCVNAKKGKV